jgi:hypothetical protein
MVERHAKIEYQMLVRLDPGYLEAVEEQEHC